jgi:hypothetical protein
MISLSLISFLFGAALGQRFKVLVLVPAMAIIIAFSIGAGLTQAQKPWWIVLMAVTASACLQFGYFTGIGTRYVLTDTRSAEAASLSTAKTSARHAAH